MVKSAEAGTANNTSTGPLSGCVLINRKVKRNYYDSINTHVYLQGQILYNYTCANTTDWPKCEVLLEQVFFSRK